MWYMFIDNQKVTRKKKETIKEKNKVHALDALSIASSAKSSRINHGRIRSWMTLTHDAEGVLQKLHLNILYICVTSGFVDIYLNI